MHVIYQTTYLPHLEGNTPPFYYVGSKHQYRGNYFGSPSAKRIEWYTNGLSICQWWKEETKNHPERFEVNILESIEDCTPQELVECELKHQKILNVMDGDLYFNSAYAALNFVSQPKHSSTKRKMAIKTKAYWESEAGKLKKEKLIERNRLVKSFEQIERWKNPTKAMLNRYTPGRPKGAKDLTPRKKALRKRKRIMIDGVIFESAQEASFKLGAPYSTITSRCKGGKYKNWIYIK